MDSWVDYIKLWKSIDIFKILDDIFKNNRVQEEVIRLNHEQLQSGEDSSGKDIVTIGGSPYRPYTVTIKKKKGQPTNVVTLKDTGDFYNTFRVKITSNGYEILADFRKGSEDIRDNFSNEFDFLGLTGESLAELVYETILPRLSKQIITKLGV